MTAPYVQCRYLRRSGKRCTAEVADEHGQVLLCAKHLARAVEMVKVRTSARKSGATTKAS